VSVSLSLLVVLLHKYEHDSCLYQHQLGEVLTQWHMYTIYNGKLKGQETLAMHFPQCIQVTAKSGHSTLPPNKNLTWKFSRYSYTRFITAKGIEILP